MGRSLRRIKKQKPKIIKRKSKKQYVKTQLPKEISMEAPSIKEKLGVEPKWDQNKAIEENYEQMGFAADLNLGTGRNKKSDTLATKATEIPEEDALLEDKLDDDLKVAMAKMRSTGKAAPKRPTPRQRQLIEKLVAAHGTDIDAMVRDRKINTMQHSKGQLQGIIDSVAYWAGKTGVDFRVPKKGLWKV